MNIYGVLNNGVHVDVSKTEHGAKCYATRNGFLTVTCRFNCGYIATEIAHKYTGKWQSIKSKKETCEAFQSVFEELLRPNGLRIG